MRGIIRKEELKTVREKENTPQPGKKVKNESVSQKSSNRRLSEPPGIFQKRIEMDLLYFVVDQETTIMML